MLNCINKAMNFIIVNHLISFSNQKYSTISIDIILCVKILLAVETLLRIPFKVVKKMFGPVVESRVDQDT